MSIELHCPQCRKLIRAPEHACGKHGKCPYCAGRVYIPSPPPEDESLDLAPLDETGERQELELRREAAEFSTDLLKARTEPQPEAADGPPSDSGSMPPNTAGGVTVIEAQIEEFLLAMRDSRLDEAEHTVAALKRVRSEAREYIRNLMLDELPPSVEDVPAPLVKGFLKTLLGRLG